MAATAIATGAGILIEPIRRTAFGLIERLHYAAALVWLVAVAASIV